MPTPATSTRASASERPLKYETTTWTAESGVNHECILIRWDDVTEALGHAHRGGNQDDEALLSALLKSGAPAWVSDADADGGIDELGWALFGPLATEPSQ